MKRGEASSRKLSRQKKNIKKKENEKEKLKKIKKCQRKNVRPENLGDVF